MDDENTDFESDIESDSTEIIADELSDESSDNDTVIYDSGTDVDDVDAEESGQNMAEDADSSEEDYCDYRRTFHVTNCEDEPDEITEYGNDYFERNNIPVPNMPNVSRTIPPSNVTVVPDVSNRVREDQCENLQASNII